MKALILAVGCMPAFFLACPASADTLPCASANLSTVIGTACDIGNLQFYFTQLASYSSVNYVPYNPLGASDFTFTVIPNGFELSVSSPQTITGPVAGYAQESYALNFDVIDETNFITGAEISGGGFEVSNPSQSIAEAAIYAWNPAQVYQFSTGISGSSPSSNTGLATGPLTAVSVQAGVFTLYASDGSTASFDATLPTSYTFLTSSTPPIPPPPPPPIPEPRGISMVLTIGVVGLSIVLKRKPLRL